MMWTIPMIRWTENRLYIRYIRKQMQREQFDTAVIYSDVAGETAVRAIKADKYLMFIIMERCGMFIMIRSHIRSVTK